MIYTQFFYFLIAAGILFASPDAFSRRGLDWNIALWLGVLLIIYCFLNWLYFQRLRVKWEREEISESVLRTEFQSLVNFGIVGAILFFFIENFLLQLKTVIRYIPLAGYSESVVFVYGMAIFLFHLAITWYWAHRFLGPVVSLVPNRWKYIFGNIKFNMIFLLPWLLISFVKDLVTMINAQWLISLQDSGLFQVTFIGGMLLLVGVFAPFFIVRLWDCGAMEDKNLEHDIDHFCKSFGVRSLKILSWNALNRGLVTAGVVGVVPPFRYLLMSPGLVDILNRDEIKAVVGHELGHIKRKHLYFYMLFFLGFFVAGFGFIDRLIGKFLYPRLEIWFATNFDASMNDAFVGFVYIATTIGIFILYFRFVMGFFLRNFEREADLYCFSCGVNPENLISSFQKLQAHLGRDRKKTNWHHYTVSQRIDFLRRCITDSSLISKHTRRIKKIILSFVVFLLALSSVAFYPQIIGDRAEANFMEGKERWLKEIRQSPQNPILYASLGEHYSIHKQWEDAISAYEHSLQLKYKQPKVLNNLAWLMLKCPKHKCLNPRRALVLARDAVALDEVPGILDTLAEAYLANGKYREAEKTSQRAYQLAITDRGLFKKKWEKMAEALIKHSGEMGNNRNL